MHNLVSPTSCPLGSSLPVEKRHLFLLNGLSPGVKLYFGIGKPAYKKMNTIFSMNMVQVSLISHLPYSFILLHILSEHKWGKLLLLLLNHKFIVMLDQGGNLLQLPQELPSI